MTAVRSGAGLLLVWLPACASTSVAPEPDPVLTAGQGRLQPDWMRPDELWTILSRSPTRYEVVERPRLEPRELHRLLVGDDVPPPRPVDPFAMVVWDLDGTPRLENRPPPPSIEATFDQAALAFAANDRGRARTLYAECALAEPDYFKTFTYLGKAHLFLGELELAEQALRRALRLNPLDYQAHLFLGDLHMERDEWRQAKEALTRSLVLNATSKEVLGRLREVLARLDLRYRDDRLAPRVRLERSGTDDGSVRIVVGPGREARWLPFGICLACWTYESECAERSPLEDDPLRLSMLRECLVSQAATVAVRRDQGEAVGVDEATLLAAIEAGYLEAIILWEVAARSAPMLTHLLAEETRLRIEAYVDRFVYVPSGIL